MIYTTVEVVVPGDPPTKARPRFGSNGSVYTPKRAVAAEEEFGWAVRAAAPGIEPDPDGQYQIWARFYQGTFHRRDLDNMIKLVSDASNGLIWVDDAQVMGIDAALERGAADPRSHVVFTKIAESNGYPTGTCPLCGVTFRLYPSWMFRNACSASCAQRLRNGVDLSVAGTCDQCAASFQRRTSAQRLCSEACRREWFRGRNRAKATPNNCIDCGISTPNHRAQRCRACWRRSKAKVIV